MRACPRVGVELSWRCNWNCQTCFYHFDKRLHSAADNSTLQIKAELEGAAERGCTHAVAVGWGEPSLAPGIMDFLHDARSLGLTTSMITNGATGLERFQAYYAAGIDHLHLSAHGLGPVLNAIAGNQTASAKQEELKAWLAASGKPWRSNTTLQLENYKQIPDIVKNLVEHGCRHVVLLGFLPHYAWNDPKAMRTVAAHPADLQPYVEEGIEIALAAERMVTLRYHPFCYLQPKYWQYVTNALYVLFDPWEWDYGCCSTDIEQVWKRAQDMAANVRVCGEPCSSCKMQLHCGGWNRYYATGLNVTLRAIRPDDIPVEHRPFIDTRGHWHDLNPANQTTGDFRHEA